MPPRRARYQRASDGHSHGEHVRDVAFAIIGVAGFGGLMYFWGQSSRPNCDAQVASLSSQLLLAQQGILLPSP